MAVIAVAIELERRREIALSCAQNWDKEECKKNGGINETHGGR
jgi:hypothetical protein